MITKIMIVIFMSLIPVASYADMPTKSIGVDQRLLSAMRKAVIKQRNGGGMMVGGPLNGSVIPDRSGGMVVGGYLNGSVMPSCNGGMMVGGALNGTVMPGCGGGMIVGGPLNGSVL